MENKRVESNLEMILARRGSTGRETAGNSEIDDHVYVQPRRDPELNKWKQVHL